MVKVQGMTLHREKGASMYEFIFVFLILMILYSVSYQYLANMTETVERTDFKRTLNRMQAQLTLKVADWYATGTVVSKQDIEGSGPAELLEVLPENYQGELHSDRLSECEVSKWCYLTDKHWWVYRAKYTAGLNNSYKNNELLVFTLKLTFAGKQNNTGLATALDLKTVYPFTWQNVGF